MKAKMDFKKIFFGLTGLVLVVTVVGTVLSNNWFGLILSFILLIGLAFLIKKEYGRDLVEEERNAIIKAAKKTKHKFKNIYLSATADDEIETTNRAFGKIEGYTKYAKQHLFLIKSGFFGKYDILLIPSYLIHGIEGKKLEGNIVVNTTGFLPNGQIFLIPNNVGKKIGDFNLKHFSSNVGWSVAIDAQRAVSKLVGIAVSSDANFLKQYAIEKQEEFKTDQ